MSLTYVGYNSNEILVSKHILIPKYKIWCEYTPPWLV